MKTVPLKSVPLGKSGAVVSEICLGAMFLGSSTDRAMSERILDVYAEAGGSFIDTANIYAWWVRGCAGGESETLIGDWMRQRKNRSRLFIASKVGFEYGPVQRGLTPSLIRAECEKSLRRMGVDVIDLYYAHVDDRQTQQEESLDSLERLVREGKVRYIGASNFLAWRLAEAQGIAASHGWAGYCCVQQRYTFLPPQPGASFAPQIAANDDLLDFCKTTGTTLLAYSPLLSGAYTRADRTLAEQYRGPAAAERLARLKALAGEKGLTPNQLVLAWLMRSSPGAIPLVAGSTVEQVREDLGAASITLTESEVAWLRDGGEHPS